MHNKIHYADSQDSLLRACDGQLSQLIDRDTRLVKAASTSAFTEDELRGLMPDKDHFGVLYVGLGATESYGPNRNADGWSRADLEKRASTFVTHGHYFREHRNRDPKLAIGSIKAAKFDPVMDRVEIFVHGHKKKAEREYERARAGKDLSCSMSARVPEDVCNCCGNRAKNASEYCSHMLEHRNQYVPEFEKYAFVDNPNPTFFDLSDVARPADRIAHYLQYRFGDGEMAKAASADAITGEEWARFEGVNLPEDPLTFDFSRRALLTKLAALEIDFALGIKSASQEQAIARHATAGLSGELSDRDIDVLRQQRPAALFAHLAKRACLLPFPEFASYVAGLPRAQTIKLEVFNKAAGMLPTIFQALLGGCVAPDEFCAGSADLMDVGGCQDDSLQPVLDRMVEKYHVMAGPVAARGIKSASAVTFRSSSSTTDLGDLDDTAKKLAHCYGLYKLSALHDMERLHGSDESAARSAIFVGHNFGKL